jgi:hypothetical protein
MAKKPGVTTIASGYYSRAALNANFEALNNAFDNTVSRDGSSPNTMDGNLDLNGNEIINGIGKFNNLFLNNALVSNLSTAFTFRSAWSGSTSYNLYDVVAESGNSYIALVAHTSGSTFSTDLAAGKWFILAAKGASGSGTGDMLGANNLSDLASAPTALGNLGLTSTTAELNYTDGVTSNIQTQLDARNAQAESAWTTGTSTTEGIVSPAKVKSAILSLGSTPALDIIAYARVSDATTNPLTVDFNTGFSSMTRTSQGNYTFTFSSARSSVDYMVFCQCASGSVSRTQAVNTQSTTAFNVDTRVISSGGTTDEDFNVIVYALPS